MHAAKLTPDARRERAAYYERIGANHMTPLWEMLRAVLDGIGGWLPPKYFQETTLNRNTLRATALAATLATSALDARAATIGQMAPLSASIPAVLGVDPAIRRGNVVGACRW